ncbi:envelope stress response membrane protein PspB [Gallaecimonas sp. GXIMD4217]|uniref:envelope stress response membrane protein PspB n=1 Tax=Gallaecimonas sp. GXIMD4217 TaxID=3131927 RepID=UPI00311B3CC0
MDDAILALILTPLVLFLIFVAPIWLIMHYRSKRQVTQGLSDDERQQLVGLSHRAEAMADRIATLERLLDAESPDWRSKS